ncbi:MAG: tetratricopeptide repeat protein [Acidobacteria bacterium]|nr:tetratricopeptide repeat protein [Acidobacteriota bacterium]
MLTLRGTVSDSAGKPLEAVRIAVRAEVGEWSYDGASDRRGRFRVELPERAATYALELSRDGFRTSQRRIRAEDLGAADRKSLELAFTLLRSQGEVVRPPEGSFRGAKEAWQLYERGLRALEAGNAVDARDLFERSLSLEPHLPPANAAMALIYLQAGEPGAAVAAVDLFLAYADSDSSSGAMVVEAKKVRRDALFALGDCDQAVAAAEELLADEPRDFGGLQVRYACAIQSGREIDAEAARRALSEADSVLGAATVMHNLGVAQFRARKLDQAAESFESALGLDPTLVPAWSGLAKSRVLAGNWQEAETAAERLLALQPQDVEGLAIRHDALVGLERWQEAAQLLDQLAERDPSPETARRLHQAGYHAYQLGDRAGARARFERATEIDPDLLIARRALATVCYDLGDYACAVEVADGILEIDPADSIYSLAERARRALAREE